jgi:holliday junction DNA helicase RuvA
VLSGLSVDELAQAVTRQDAATLKRLPGIGQKTAERLLLELKGKLGADIEGTATGLAGAPDCGPDVLRALLALGYSEREATAAAHQVPSGTSVSEGIRIALRSFAKA